MYIYIIFRDSCLDPPSKEFGFCLFNACCLLFLLFFVFLVFPMFFWFLGFRPPPKSMETICGVTRQRVCK